jgi:N-acetylglucosaminyl-diphospho-decaprenol L-rhamnosyltransferase
MASQRPQHAPTRVAAITVSYGSLGVLPALLASIDASSASDVHTLVADNKAQGSDNARAIVEEFEAGYVPLDGNVGYGSAINAAARDLPPTIDWILVVNPDVVLGAGSIDALVAMGDSDARIASVGPQTLTPDGEVYPSARSVPSLRTGVGHALFANLWLDNPWTRAYRNDTTVAPVLRDAGWLSGACVLVRRTVFEAMGGFDEGYFMYFEDVDLGYRIGKNGYRNVYEPAAKVTHTGAHSTNSESERMISAHHASARRFLSRKYSGAWLWPVRVTLTIGLALRSALVRRRVRRASPASG